MKQRKVFCVRIAPEYITWLHDRAEHEERSLTVVMERLIRQVMEAEQKEMEHDHVTA